MQAFGQGKALKTEVRFDFLLFQGFQLIHTVQLLLPSAGHLGFPAGYVLPYEIFCFFDFFLLRIVLTYMVLAQKCLLFQKLRIAAVILGQPAVVYIADTCETTIKAFSIAER